MYFFENVLNNININSGSIASLLFLFVIIFVAIVSVILFFHWRRYGISKVFFAFVEVVYLGICAVLISVAFFSLN